MRTVRLTVETVGGDRTRPYALTVFGHSYGFYGQLLRLIKPGLTVEASYCLQHSKDKHLRDASKEETATGPEQGSRFWG